MSVGVVVRFENRESPRTPEVGNQTKDDDNSFVDQIDPVPAAFRHGRPLSLMVCAKVGRGATRLYTTTMGRSVILLTNPMATAYYCGLKLTTSTTRSNVLPN